jgi:hypothetical protein
MQVNVRREVLAQQSDALRHKASVICVEGCAPDAAREFRERDATDLEAVVDHRELRHWRVYWSDIAHSFNSQATDNPKYT